MGERGGGRRQRKACTTPLSRCRDVEFVWGDVLIYCSICSSAVVGQHWPAAATTSATTFNASLGNVSALSATAAAAAATATHLAHPRVFVADSLEFSVRGGVLGRVLGAGKQRAQVQGEHAHVPHRHRGEAQQREVEPWRTVRHRAVHLPSTDGRIQGRGTRADKRGSSREVFTSRSFTGRPTVRFDTSCLPWNANGQGCNS